MAFYVGQKVVRFRFGAKCPHVLPHEKVAHIAIGEVVTVRDVVREKRRSGQLEIGLRFEEYVNPTYHYTVGAFELDYRAENFRPIVERKTDISIFKAMLNPSKTEVTA